MSGELTGQLPPSSKGGEGRPYRPELEPIPENMRSLHVRRGYPVPFFVQWHIDGRPVRPGHPKALADFRVMDPRAYRRCFNERRCWVCGQAIHKGDVPVFVIGPMCAINRTSAEPPSHRECGEWSARNCPFLARPYAKRRDTGDLPRGEVPGVMLTRNPGVAMTWASTSWYAFKVPHGVLFDVGDPVDVKFWAHGRPATRAEVEASIESGLPSLMELAEQEGYAAVCELRVAARKAKALLPAA